MNKRLRFVLISTTSDIGYNFIVMALRDLLHDIFGSDACTIDVIDKHAPFGEAAYRGVARQKIAQADAIIWAGGPIYWPYVERAPWAAWLVPAIKHAAEAGTPFLALAIGACYPYDGDRTPTLHRREEEDFVADLLSVSQLNVARDQATSALLERAFLVHECLPCIATLFRPQLIEDRLEFEGGVAFNYMRGGGHHDYLNAVDPIAWHRTAVAMVSEIKNRQRLVFLAHSTKEHEQTSFLDADLDAYLPSSAYDYTCLAQCLSVAVNSRIHATLILATMGVPSLTIGSDSRLQTIEELGLPVLSVQEAVALGSSAMSAKVEGLMTGRDQLMSAIDTQIEGARSQYRAALEGALQGIG